MSGPEDLLDRPAPRAGLDAVRALGRFEPGRPDLAKGVRAGLALGAALVVGAAAGGVSTAVLACLGALNVVMADVVAVAFGRRATGLAMAAILNAGTLTLGLLAGPHLWSALVVMAPITLLAGMAGITGERGAANGLTSAAVYLVGLGLAGSGTDPGLAFLEMLAGGAGAIPILMVRLPPDKFGPARRAVAGALTAVADVYGALASELAGSGRPAEKASGLARVARQRLNAARQVLDGYAAPRRRDGLELVRLGSLTELGRALLVRSEPLSNLARLLGRQQGAEPALDPLRTMTTSVATALRARAAGLRAATSPGEPVPAGLAQGLEDLGDVADRLHDRATGSADAELVERAVATLAVIRPVQDVGRGIVGLWHDPPPAPSPVRAPPGATARDLGHRFRRALSPRSAVGRRSLQFAVTAMVGYALGEQLGLDKPYWVTVTIAVILQPAAAPSLQRALLRLSGTAAGALLGAVLLTAVRQQAALMVLISVLGVAAFALVRINYGLGITFVTPIVLLVVSLPHPGGWQVALTRLEATALGVGLVLTSGLLLWPGSAPKRIARQLASGLVGERRYLDTAWAAIDGTEPADPRQLARLRRDAALNVDNAEADLDRWLGDVPRRRDRVGLFWSLTDIARSIHLEVSTIAARVPDGAGHRPPPEFRRAVQELGAGLQRVADDLTGSAALTSGHEDQAVEEALRQVKQDVEELQRARAAELVAGEIELSETGQAVRQLGVIELTLQRLGESLREAEADVQALRSG